MFNKLKKKLKNRKKPVEQKKKGLHDQFNIIIKDGGVAEHIYDQNFITETFDKDTEILKMKRASNVEPDPENLGTWYVDLSPVKGPTFKGFTNRNDALRAEVKWLNENYYQLEPEC